LNGPLSGDAGGPLSAAGVTGTAGRIGPAGGIGLASFGVDGSGETGAVRESGEGRGAGIGTRAVSPCGLLLSAEMGTGRTAGGGDVPGGTERRIVVRIDLSGPGPGLLSSTGTAGVERISFIHGGDSTKLSAAAS